MVQFPISFSNIRPWQQTRPPEPIWASGDIIDATLVELQGDKARLRLSDNTEFTAHAHAIKGEIGETLTFQVNQHAKGLTLTQIFEKPRQEAVQRGNALPEDELKTFTNTLENIKECDELRTEKRQEQARKSPA